MLTFTHFYQKHGQLQKWQKYMASQSWRIKQDP